MKSFIALVFAILVTPAAAQKPFSIDFTSALHGPDGKPLPGASCAIEPGRPVPTVGKTCDAMTLGEVAMTALEATLDEDKAATPKAKFDNDFLARKIYGKKDVILSSEEIAKIKDRIGKAYGPLVVGASWPLLDPSLRQ